MPRKRDWEVVKDNVSERAVALVGAPGTAPQGFDHYFEHWNEAEQTWCRPLVRFRSRYAAKRAGERYAEQHLHEDCEVRYGKQSRDACVSLLMPEEVAT